MGGEGGQGPDGGAQVFTVHRNAPKRLHNTAQFPKRAWEFGTDFPAGGFQHVIALIAGFSGKNGFEKAPMHRRAFGGKIA